MQGCGSLVPVRAREWARLGIQHIDSCHWLRTKALTFTRRRLHGSVKYCTWAAGNTHESRRRRAPAAAASNSGVKHLAAAARVSLLRPKLAQALPPTEAQQ